MRASQVLSGLGWSGGATAANAMAQFAFLAVLARLLDAEAFGLMAMAIICLRFASFFAQLGFAQALIQKPRLEPADTTAALVLAAGLGSAFYAAVLLAAPLFAAYFRTPELPAVLGGLGWTLIVGTIAGLPHALLRREGRFKAAAGIETAAYVLGYGGVGIAAAAAGWGVWSLIAATLAHQGLMGVLGFALARPTFAWPVPRAAYAGLWRFGSRYSAIGFLEFVWANVETLIIGRAFGKAELGIFNRAITLTNLPVEQAVSAVNKVMFPAFASLAADSRRLGDAFCMFLLAVGIASAALACGTAGAAADVVALLLGARWAAASPVVAMIAFAVPPMFMYVVCGITLDSVAALGPKLRLQAVLLFAKLALVAVAASQGLVAVAGAVVVAEAIRLAFGLRLVGRTLGMEPAACWTPVAASAAVGAAVYAAVASAAALSQAAAWPLAARFAAEAGAGTLALLAALLLLVVCMPGYAPIARFESVRGWHRRLRVALHLPPVAR